jgi:hypothetical protein
MHNLKILLVALMALMAIGGIEMASAATTTITATIAQSVEISAPSSAAITFHVGDNDVAMTPDIQINTNMGSWYLQANGGGDGYFRNGNTYLNPAFTVTVDSSAGKYNGNGPQVLTSGSAQTLTSGGVPGLFSVPTKFEQHVSYTDVGPYTTAITFTAGA